MSEKILDKIKKCLALAASANEHEAARRGGANSRAWIEFARTMFESFPALYAVAEAMNGDQAKQRQAAGWTRAVTSVVAERQRQLKAEGCTDEHDDKHDSGATGWRRRVLRPPRQCTELGVPSRPLRCLPQRARTECMAP